MLLKKGSEGYEKLNDLASLGIKNGFQRLYLKGLDLTDNESIDDIAKYVEECKKQKKISHLWALINNAGVLVAGDFDWLTTQQIELTVNVNLLGNLKITKALLPDIILTKGRVVNISSVADTGIGPFVNVYGATKSAVSSFGDYLRIELRKFNCHVVNIRPGVFAGLSNIMNQQKAMSEKMCKSMSPFQQRLYKKYFDLLNSETMLCNPDRKLLSPLSFKNSPIFRDLDIAVMAERPPRSITVAPISHINLYFG